MREKNEAFAPAFLGCFRLKIVITCPPCEVTISTNANNIITHRNRTLPSKTIVIDVIKKSIQMQSFSVRLFTITPANLVSKGLWS
jgi:hypothetical protein